MYSEESVLLVIGEMDVLCFLELTLDLYMMEIKISDVCSLIKEGSLKLTIIITYEAVSE